MRHSLRMLIFGLLFITLLQFLSIAFYFGSSSGRLFQLASSKKQIKKQTISERDRLLVYWMAFKSGFDFQSTLLHSSFETLESNGFKWLEIASCKTHRSKNSAFVVEISHCSPTMLQAASSSDPNSEFSNVSNQSQTFSLFFQI